MRNAGVDEAQAGIKIARRNINNLRYADDTRLMAENKEDLKSLWETVETVADFILGGSKIIVGGGCIHEIKRCLLLGRKVMTNLDSILKSRDITLPRSI